MATLPLTAPPAGEDYASVSEILLTDDLRTATIRVPAWGGAALRIRALSLDAQAAVRSAAARAVSAQDRAVGITQHYPTFVAMTIQLGVITPMFTWEQARALMNKSSVATEAISETIWAISIVDQQTIDAVMDTLAQGDGLEVAPAPTEDADADTVAAAA